MLNWLKTHKAYIVSAVGVAGGVALICLGHPVAGVTTILSSLNVGAYRLGAGTKKE